MTAAKRIAGENRIFWEFRRAFAKVARGQFNSARRNFSRGFRRSVIRLAALLCIRNLRSPYGPKFALNAKDETFFYYIDGSYGHYFWNYLAGIDHPFVFIDVGANQGLYTIGAAMNPNLVRAYAFEPVAETFSFLIQNLRLNHVEPQCEPLQIGISDKPGSAEIVTTDGHSGIATLRHHYQDESGGNVQSVSIRTVNRHGLEKLVPERNFPLVAKIDVEGLEVIVLRELLSTAFSKKVIGIFLEVDEEWIDRNQIYAMLNEAGFREFVQVGTGEHYDLLATRT